MGALCISAGVKKVPGRRVHEYTAEEPPGKPCTEDNRMLWIVVLLAPYLPSGSFHKSWLPYTETWLRHPAESINTLSNVIL